MPIATDPCIADTSFFELPSALPPDYGAGAKSILVAAYAMSADLASRARRALNPNRPAVLMICSHLNGIPLAERFDRSDCFALFLSRWISEKKNYGGSRGTSAAGFFPSTPRPHR